MKKYLIIFIIMLFYIISCKENRINDNIVDNNLEKVIENYVKKNPIQPFPKDYKKWGLNYPSYNIYFDLYEKDTIMAIVLLPMIDNFLKKKLIGDSLYTFKKEDGFYLFDKNSPVVFFDTKLYDNYLHNRLIKPVPDSLKFNKSSGNIGSKELELYKIKNKEFLLINKKDALYNKITQEFLGYW